MVKAMEIPVIWKTKRAVADRLLGKAGRPLLDKLLERSLKAAVEQKWPLKEIKIQHYEDPEEDWEYLLLALDFDCSEKEAEIFFWDGFVNTISEGMYRELKEPEKGIFLRKIHYELESNP